ncbi:carboxylesterase [Candidatus Planktophila dulcis]|jgi:ribosome-associated toxin RatA of RatAB toxin-antitoxin module|uniref:Carboxylesterase n=1 Tax=Candidatus Planktophila dulcis TaxID=1884914 RepID=A0AAC9YTV0_9ACTN|nr:SRPBCC family protein [Candidatus Planktophila dulcis]ASY12144.1 carboxylesterase [Candidatus Planktophila dulcis]ASY14715.1 carboxylesterase [Candidatus Planktophila dulcis]
MSEKSVSTVVIDAPLAEVQAALFEIGSYPEWLSSIKKADVIERDGENRVLKAKLAIDAGMMKDRVTLDYDWSAAPAALSFTMDEADLLTQMDGTYLLKAIDADTTQVTYELTVAVSLPVPSMMITKAQKQTIDAALKELAERVA